MMKAIVYSDEPRERIRFSEIEKPTPADDEVLVRVAAASVNPLDWRIAFAPIWLRKMMSRPKRGRAARPGVDVAGTIEAVGRSVTRFKDGEEVFGVAAGAFAEFACTTESLLAHKPTTVTFEEAAALPVAALTALQGLRDRAHLRCGQSILINGAAGGIGTYAVQIAKSMGAQITGVCSTRNVDMVRSLGADRVVDYTGEDFAQGRERYDVILDNVGNRALGDLMGVLKKGGIVVAAGGPKSALSMGARILGMLLRSAVLRQRFVFFIARVNTEDLAVLAEMMTSGKLKSIIDRRYPLAEVPEALRYVETGHARAKVVIGV